MVEAYNPTTGKPEAEPIQTIWVNHDHDLVDVHLAPAGSSSSAHMPVALRTSGHGHIIGDDATATVRLATPSTTHTAAGGETIHTTANHPWLTSDRGWIEAGQLQVGEAVVTLYGSSGTVAWVHVVPGQADMYNLTVAHDHTYAVGAGWWVVHNSGGTIDTCFGPNNSSQLPARQHIGFAQRAATEGGNTTAGVWVMDANGAPIMSEASGAAVTSRYGPATWFPGGPSGLGGCAEFRCGATAAQLYDSGALPRGNELYVYLWHAGSDDPCPSCRNMLNKWAEDNQAPIHVYWIDDTDRLWGGSWPR